MKVLDINSNCCWSFHGPDGNTIARLRAAVGIENPQLREVVLQRIEGKAFGFVGEATKLEFSRGFFDEVHLTFTPTVEQRVQLRQCIRRWSKDKSALREETETSEFSRLDSFWRRMFGRFVPLPAS